MASRNTEQQAIVRAALNTLANHPTADEVYDYIHEEHPSISKATVYRVLNKLADKNLAMHIRINNGADHYDHQVFEHFHIRCSVCGRVDDVKIPALSSIIEQAQQSNSYAIEGYSLQFDGVCPTCQAAQTKSA